MVKYFEQSYRVSERHACCVLELARATYRYEGHQEQWIELRMRIREIAQTRVRYGYRMIRVLLNREGWKVGKDLVYRLYKEEGLGLRKRPVGRRRAVVHRQERFRPTGPNQVWAMDFVADQLCDGRRFRSLTIVDIYTRESLAIEVGQSLRGEDVVRVLNRLKEQRGVPKLLFCDNGAEFTGQRLDLWAYRNSVKIDFSRPGKPTDNAFVESFNGTFRSECLDTNWFQNLTEAQQMIEAWRREYNESRPHRALANRTPEEFASQIAVNRDLISCVSSTSTMLATIGSGWSREAPERRSPCWATSLYRSRFRLLEPNVVATSQGVHCRRKRDPEKRAISLEVSRVIARSERISPTTEENLNP
jgi:putative transposase